MPNEVAVFGGGCFWCTEAVFGKLRGVVQVVSGYAGGNTPNPNYFQVSEELTGHAEVIEITFDPEIISYQTLLDIFWHVHDPTSRNQQGADIGTQYRSIILTTTPEQQRLAEAARAEAQKSKEFRDQIVTEVKPLEKFYPAETYHQNYFQKNPDQPYCNLVISPKVEHFLKKYGSLTKTAVNS
jgi:peptide-methionine (S)-S-oxide reductase